MNNVSNESRAVCTFAVAKLLEQFAPIAGGEQKVLSGLAPYYPEIDVREFTSDNATRNQWIDKSAAVITEHMIGQFSKQGGGSLKQTA